MKLCGNLLSVGCYLLATLCLWGTRQGVRLGEACHAAAERWYRD